MAILPFSMIGKAFREISKRSKELSIAIQVATLRIARPTDGVNFVIIFLPRTGSNYLAGKLDVHPQVICHHELFNANEPHESLSVREGEIPFDFGTAKERDQDLIKFLEIVYGTRRGHPAVGFKLGVTECWPVFIGILFNRGVHKIILRRDNLLETFVSSELANKAGSWIQFVDNVVETDGDSVRQVNVNPEKFKYYVRKRWCYNSGIWLLSRLDPSQFHIIEYTEIKDQRHIARLLRFLRVEVGGPLRERTRRQNPQALRDKIENPDELLSDLQGTSFAAYVREIEPVKIDSLL